MTATRLLRRFLLRLAWLAANLRWLAGRGPRTKLHRGPLVGKVACECCPGEPREATKVVWSELERRDVHFCEWCWRRFRKRNQARAIPRTRKPSKRGGRPGGRAA